MSQANAVLLFPKGGKPSMIANEWQVWNADESELSKLDQKQQVLVPFSWWLAHGQADAKNAHSTVAKRIAAKTIGVWFAADEDILKHAEVIKAGKSAWSLVAADFPIFRDGRSFSTAALLRDRLGWDKEIRMIGDVLIDQLLQGARVGFDSFALRPDQNLDLALKQFDLFTVSTQNSWRGKRSLLATN